MELPADVRALVDDVNFAHVATVLPDGAPHSVAVWIGTAGDRLVFFTQEASRKARNLARDPRVAISIADRANPYRAAYLRGRVVETRTGEAALPLIDALSQKYTGAPFPMRTGTAYLVEPTMARALTLPFTAPA